MVWEKQPDFKCTERWHNISPGTAIDLNATMPSTSKQESLKIIQDPSSEIISPTSKTKSSPRTPKSTPKLQKSPSIAGTPKNKKRFPGSPSDYATPI